MATDSFCPYCLKPLSEHRYCQACGNEFLRSEELNERQAKASEGRNVKLRTAVAKWLLLFGAEAGLTLSIAACMFCGPAMLLCGVLLSFWFFSFLSKAYAKSAEYKYGKIAARGLHGLVKSLVCAMAIFLVPLALFFVVSLALCAVGI